MSNPIGSEIQELDTPALLLNVQALDRNLKKMAAFFHGRPCQLRPHFKNHKCTQLARRQLSAGSALGMTCAKVGEAEVLVAAGFDNLLIANQVVGQRKLQRLVAIADRAQVRVAVDAPEHLAAISDAANTAGVNVGILIEVDIGMRRCGVPPGSPALGLVQQIETLPGITFDGIQAYEGHLPYLENRDVRRQQSYESMQLAIDTRQLIEQAGFPVAVISGGSSSTYDATGLIDGVDELQAGTYATMDWVYHGHIPEFELAMTLATRVISCPRPGVAVLDVGVKGAGHEFGPPRVSDNSEATIANFGSEEHCVVENVPHWKIGQVVQLWTSHACTTCNLHREFCVVENDRVIDVWPIDGSGKLT